MAVIEVEGGGGGGGEDRRPVFFFDIDNCLYPKSNNVHDHMAVLINKYFIKHLDVPTEEATRLHHQYYKDYGLAIEGLSRFHQIDPMDFNREVDDALPWTNCWCRTRRPPGSSSLSTHRKSRCGCSPTRTSPTADEW